MRIVLAVWILLALAGHANIAFGDGRCDSPDNETRVQGETECLVIRTFRSADPGESPKLIVFIHGDVSSGGAADYIYERAQESVANGRVVVALLRPGYFDSSGNQSTGDNFDSQDSYTRHNIDAIAAALKALREHHKARHLILRLQQYSLPVPAISTSGGQAAGGGLTASLRTRSSNKSRLRVLWWP